MRNVAGHTSRVASTSLGSVNRREFRGCPDGRRRPSNWPSPEAFHRFVPVISRFEDGASLNSASDFAQGLRNIKWPAR